MIKFFNFLISASRAVQAVVLLLMMVLLLSFGYALYNMFTTTNTKTETFAMNEWQVLKKQKLIIGEIDGKAVGRYGYRKVIHSRLLGERHDTLAWWAPGSRYADINGPVNVTVGYDMLGGDKIFSENSVGVLRQTDDSLVLQVITDYPVPAVLGNSLKTIPTVSNSLLTGKIADAEFFPYADSVIALASEQIIENEKDFFLDAYSEVMIGILSQSLAPVAKGKNIRIELIVNGTPYVPDGRTAKRLENIEFNVGGTKVF